MSDIVDKSNFIYFIVPLFGIVLVQLVTILLVGWKEYHDDMKLNFFVAVTGIALMMWLYSIGWYD